MSQTHFGPQPVFSSCLHRNIRVYHVGRWTFYQGEVFDNVQEQVVCLDCNKTVTESDVRAAWSGYSTFATTLEEQDELQ